MSVSPEKTPKSAARSIAWITWGFVLFMAIISFWLRSSNLEDMPGPTAFYINNFIFWMLLLPLAPPAYATVAALIMSRKPESKVGWMCLMLALVILVEDISWQYTQRAMVYAPGSLPMGQGIAWVNQLFSALMIPPTFLALMLYYFPNNRLPARGWLVGVLLGVISLVAMSFAVILSPEIITSSESAFPNPTSIPALTNIAEPLFSIGGILGVASLLGGAASVVARWRKANGVERAQIKWLAMVSVLMIVVTVTIVMLPIQPETDLISALLLLLAVSLVAIALPAAIGVAVLRYKLWDIDLIIRRTLAYTLVTGLLALVYFSSVVLLQQFFRTVTGENSRLSVVISTLAIAALFNPVRQRMQMFIDRRFYRSRYDAVHMLAGFSETARDVVELDALAEMLTDAVQGSMHPRRVGICFKE